MRCLVLAHEFGLGFLIGSDKRDHIGVHTKAGAITSISALSARAICSTCEEYDCKYAIRLKIDSTLITLAEDKAETLRQATKYNMVDYAVTFGEFMYQAGKWSHPRRVVFKIEKPVNQMTFLYTFMVTKFRMNSKNLCFLETSPSLLFYKLSDGNTIILDINISSSDKKKHYIDIYVYSSVHKLATFAMGVPLYSLNLQDDGRIDLQAEDQQVDLQEIASVVLHEFLFENGGDAPSQYDHIIENLQLMRSFEHTVENMLMQSIYKSEVIFWQIRRIVVFIWIKK